MKQPQGQRRSRHTRARARATQRPPAAERCTPARAFDALWLTLVDVLGHTATAALMQRSIKRAAEEAPELSAVTITREQFGYRYSLPESWEHTDATASHVMERIVRHLWPLLAELTGPVIVRRLRQNPVLQECGVIPKDVEP